MELAAATTQRGTVTAADREASLERQTLRSEAAARRKREAAEARLPQLIVANVSCTTSARQWLPRQFERQCLPVSGSGCSACIPVVHHRRSGLRAPLTDLRADVNNRR